MMIIIVVFIFAAAGQSVLVDGGVEWRRQVKAIGTLASENIMRS